MAVTNPERKSVRPGEVVGIDLGNGWNMRQPGDGELDPGRERSRRESQCAIRCQDGWSNPDAEAAVLLDSELPDVRHQKKSWSLTQALTAGHDFSPCASSIFK